MPPSPLSAATSHHRTPSPSVSVVIPALDPAGLPSILRALPPVDEVIVVGTGLDLSARPGAVLVPPSRPGLGNAIACGVRAAHGDIVVTLNGDGSTDPADIPRFVRALVAGADVALGSRYSPGGGDLTGGRLRRWADLLLIWLLNTVLGLHRTDPGFGYAAFWRDAVPALGLTDPGTRGTAWGEGPEIGALLALRPAARGLRVAEVPSIARPPARGSDHDSARGSAPATARSSARTSVRASGRSSARASGRASARADRPRLRHWLRAALDELRGGDRPAWAPPAPIRNVAYPGLPRRAPLNNETGAGRRALDRRAVEALAAERQASERLIRERTTVRQFTGTKGWAQTDRRPVPQPVVQAPFHRVDPRNGQPPVWRDGHPERLGGPDVQPRSAQTPWRLAPGATQPVRREVGTRRRRIEGLRQSRPDLRVINGEGTGTTGRRARLRSVD
ncbi:glycosyltransferase family 2 protein [Paractinoplanes lichenicola]|uniref:Glycosyltransferase n=1 Tax=Paractinoplanes lichenicola TaxID=2802976 RepID=A0ABS1VJQ3_9ACTN|nr:glycosyltransferase family 2 protein [Actinoplanes lichenicola]MBL7254384.1 glycosyltransferase [Actinoplanes lichenicola]